MVKSLCSSESDRYSSPVPYVGLYIAGATLVCLLLMLCDMISSFRRRTRYLPCKLFSINSVTLFLLATTSKLPVDLTTYMPSHADQLSKLSSTAMLCVSISFLAPSLGINREAESITNLITLSLMVITIVVNVCIQMYTGVIFSLVIEHIIILCCMMSLLPLLWWSISANNSGKRIMTDANRDLFKKGTEAKSFVHQAKLWYMCSCITNPQYLICGLVSPIMAANCATCLAVLLYAAFRSIVFHKSEFCKGVSDYGWSIWIIVITQIITVMVGSLGSFFRSIDRLGTVLLSSRGDRSGLQQMNPSHHIESEMVAFNFFTKKKGLGKVVSIIMLSRLLLRSLVLIISLCVMIIFGLIPGLSIIVCVLVLHLLHSACPTIHLIMTSSDSGASKITSPWKQELQHHVSSVIEGFPERIMRVCAEDMKKWMDASNRNPLNHLVKFLSEPPSSTAVLDEVQQIGSKTFSKGYRLSCLTFVILERIISFSIPSARAEPITRALDEAFEMIYYIDGKINVSKFDDQRKHHLAKTLWAYKGVYLSKNGSSTHSNNSSMSDAISSIKNERQQFRAGELVAREMEVIISFILTHQAECTSMEEVYHHLEQLFIDMLHFVLSQLPIAILKDVNESPVEAHEERARFVLKLLYKLKSLEDKIRWSFPEGYRVTRLMDTEGEGINDEAGNTENQNATPVDDDHDGGATTIQEVPDVEIGSQG